MRPDISIILCTYNRAQHLAGSLASFSQAIQYAADVTVEVVLVNNNSTDDTLERLNNWAAQQSFATHVVTETKKGLGAARNAGLRTATGNILCFTDDDCHLEENYFSTLANLYKSDNKPVFRGGQVLLGNPEDMPYTIRTETQPEELTNITNQIHGFIHGCNMAFPRTIYESVGMFDERYGAGTPFISGEDTDYIIRSYRRGFRVTYTPELVVHHFHGRNTEDSIIKLFRGYYAGNGALYGKYLFYRPIMRIFIRRLKRGIKCGIKTVVTPYKKESLDKILQDPRLIAQRNIKGIGTYFGHWCKSLIR